MEQIVLKVSPDFIGLKVTNAKVIYIGGEPYRGPVVVTPSIEGQALPTTDKLIGEDIIIKPIPYASVTNSAGGKTITIGG